MSAPGYLLPSELIVVQAAGNVRMATKAGRQFLAFRDWLAEEHHISLGIALPAGGYRDHAMDVDMHNNPLKYNINPAIGLLPVGLSAHAKGICFDAVPVANAIVNANAGRFGFSRPIAVDINHFQYNGTTVTAGAGAIPVDADAPPPPPPIGDIDMEIYEDRGTADVASGQFWAGAPGRWQLLNNAAFGGDAHVRDLLTAVNAKPIINLSAVDIVRVGALWVAMAPPVSGGSVTVDNTAVLAALTALGQQESTDQAALLAAISNVDEATLATFGLKRA
jgi:hypothetical protein